MILPIHLHGHNLRSVLYIKTHGNAHKAKQNMTHYIIMCYYVIIRLIKYSPNDNLACILAHALTYLASRQ